MAATMHGYMTPFGGIRIYESELITEVEEYQETIQLSFRQRWIEPLRHPVVLPFEPWVKTRVVTRSRNVPSRKIIQTEQGYFVHPAMKRELIQAIQSQFA